MAEKILIIDDDMDTLRLVGMLLQRKGYEIVAASNGNAALEKVRTENPDLILLDVMMPDMDGYEVLRRLRTLPTAKSTPVIMFTAKAQVDDKVAGFEAGADDYLNKPTHPAELLARVKTILARARVEAPAITSPRSNAMDSSYAGKMIGILAAKGGQGVTTAAINLAAIYSKIAGNSIIAADMLPGDGSLSTYLGINVQGGLVNLLNMDPGQINQKNIAGALTQHHLGISLLPASYLPSDAKYLLKTEQYAAIAREIRTMARFIVFDLGSNLLPSIEKVVEQCDQLIVIVDPLSNNMNQTKALLGELSLRVLGLNQITLVLSSRIRSEKQMNLRDVQDRLGHSVAASISPAPDLAYRAAIEGIPMVFMQPDSLITQQYAKIAQTTIRTGQLMRS